MDGYIEIDDSLLGNDLYHNNEELEKIKNTFCNSIGKVFMRNLEFTTKKKDFRVFKVEFASNNTGVLFSTLDSTKHFVESSLYIPFNMGQITFFNSLMLKTEPIENYRIKYYEKKIYELQISIENLELSAASYKATLGHFKKMIFDEQNNLAKMTII